jgi:hypothetical protein
MSSGSLLCAALLTAGVFGGSVAAPRSFESELAEVVVEEGEAGVELLAYDAEGVIIGILALWVDDDGDVHVASEYDDGYGDVVIVGEVPYVQTSLPLATIEARAGLITDVLAATRPARGRRRAGSSAE